MNEAVSHVHCIYARALGLILNRERIHTDSLELIFRWPWAACVLEPFKTKADDFFVAYNDRLTLFKRILSNTASACRGALRHISGYICANTLTKTTVFTSTSENSYTSAQQYRVQQKNSSDYHLSVQSNLHIKAYFLQRPSKSKILSRTASQHKSRKFYLTWITGINK